MLPITIKTLLSITTWSLGVLGDFSGIVYNVELERVHICGGRENLSIGRWRESTTDNSNEGSNIATINNLYTGVGRFERKLGRVIHQMRARVDVAQREHIPELVGQPVCFDPIHVDNHSVEHISTTMTTEEILNNLRADMGALQTCLGIIQLTEDEHSVESSAFAARIARVRIDIKSLMCKMALFMIGNGAEMTLEVTPEVEVWCQAEEHCTRFQRDAVLFTQIFQLSEKLEEKYLYLMDYSFQ